MKWIVLLKTLLYAKSKAFFGFFVTGNLLWFPILFVNLDIQHWGLVFLVKAAGAIALAFCTGVAGALGNQAVDYYKKYPMRLPTAVRKILLFFKRFFTSKPPDTNGESNIKKSA